MTVEVPPVLREQPTDVLVDAVYFVVRSLRNVTRGYSLAHISSEPSDDVRDLAHLAIAQIEAREQSRLTGLSDDRINEYIEVLEAMARQRYLETVGDDPTVAAAVLREMRSSGTGPE